MNLNCQTRTIRIDKEGSWFYNDLPIINKKVYLFFNQHIQKDPEGGYVLQIGAESCKIIVEDTPYVVVSIVFVDSDCENGQFFKVRLNDETEEELDLASFYIGRDNIPYCSVKNGQFPARFLRPPYYHLAGYILAEADNRFYILLNNDKFYIKYAAG